MKLDPKNVRHLSAEDWRVLSSVEQGSRNHEVVPTPLITNISSLAHRTSITRCISTLAKNNLVSRVRNARYDGYRLTYGGLDYLALHAHLKADVIYSVGNQIGVGKEADIFVVAAPPDGAGDPAKAHKLVLKIHRLGRISFRSVKTNRDYLRNRNSGSWMHMSRLAAHKEYSFLQALYNADFPVPRPVGWNRHTVVMDLVDALALRQISEVPDPAGLYEQLIELILRFARVGLIHGDFNEFNILIEEQEDAAGAVTLKPIVIDFPQAISISHANAEFYFDRDVACIKRFFQRRFGFTSDEPGPFFADVTAPANLKGAKRLDIEVEASGFSKKMAKELEGYMVEVGAEGVAQPDQDEQEHEGDEEAELADEQTQEPHEEEEPVDPTSFDDMPPPDAASFTPIALDSTTAALGEVTLDDIQKDKDEKKQDDLASVAYTSRTTKSRRPPPNPAKVAKGWAI